MFLSFLNVMKLQFREIIFMWCVRLIFLYKKHLKDVQKWRFHNISQELFNLSFVQQSEAAKSFSYPVTHDRHLSVAQQGCRCFISEPVILTATEVWRVHASAFALHSCGCVVQMNATLVAITFRNLTGRRVWKYILRLKTIKRSAFLVS